MAVATLETHVQDALARLLSQFAYRPNLTALITALAAQIQALENAAAAVPAGCFLDAAQGAQLDGLGSIVGQPRNNLSDALYGLFLRGKIAANSSKGDHETLLRLVQSLFIASSAAIRGSYPQGGAPYDAPAAIGIEVGAPMLSPTLFDTALGLVTQAMAAGVVLAWATIYAGDDAFAFAGATGGLGFASDDGSTPGGALAQTLYTSPEA